MSRSPPGFIVTRVAAIVFDTRKLLLSAIWTVPLFVSMLGGISARLNTKVVMNAVATGLADQDMADVAAYYASCPRDNLVNSQGTASSDEQISRLGAFDRIL